MTTQAEMIDNHADKTPTEIIEHVRFLAGEMERDLESGDSLEFAELMRDQGIAIFHVWYGSQDRG